MHLRGSTALAKAAMKPDPAIYGQVLGVSG